MRSLCLLSLSLFFLFACNPQKKAQQPAADADTAATVVAPPAEPAKQIYRVETPFTFSDPEKLDKFGLVVVGQNVMEGTATFTITTAEGTELFREEFPTTDLIDPSFTADRETAPSEKERRDYVVKRLKEFFGKANFSQPAIGPQDTFDPARSKKAIWKEMAEDPRSVAFYYLVGDHQARELVFSKRQGKVVVFRTW